ncbi:hypothetical protein FB107DRAFT_187608, partial [Schizophyllum commune]
PHRDCINNILDVVVDQFDELYDPGVYISRTARHSHGRRVEAVLKISANDLPAARQLSGQASHAHTHGCNVCDTPVQDLDNLNMATWHIRNWEEEKQWGLAWKNATSIMEQEEIYELHGLRYSPLQRLPTFDVIMCTVLDTMHMFAEGLIPTHLRKVYGMDRNTVDGAGLATFSGRRSSEEDFSAGFYVLQWGNDSLLTGLKERLAEIDHDAETLILPSSMQAAPKSAGERKGGKFKAASWLTYALVNLPITLIRLWGGAPPDSRERAMLDNYMHLVKAIRLASLPYMTSEVIESYTSEMHRYLTTLLELFPGTTITIYQHLSLHLPLLLAEHGPTHAWRCWVVERMNHVLQTLNTNNKFG